MGKGGLKLGPEPKKSGARNRKSDWGETREHFGHPSKKRPMLVHQIARRARKDDSAGGGRGSGGKKRKNSIEEGGQSHQVVVMGTDDSSKSSTKAETPLGVGQSCHMQEKKLGRGKQTGEEKRYNDQRTRKGIVQSFGMELSFYDSVGEDATGRRKKKKGRGRLA